MWPSQSNPTPFHSSKRISVISRKIRDVPKEYVSTLRDNVRQCWSEMKDSTRKKHIKSYTYARGAYQILYIEKSEKERERSRLCCYGTMGLSLELFQELRSFLWTSELALKLRRWPWSSGAVLELCRWLRSSRPIQGYSLGLDWESKGTPFGWGPEIIENHWFSLIFV